MKRKRCQVMELIFFDDEREELGTYWKQERTDE